MINRKIENLTQVKEVKRNREYIKKVQRSNAKKLYKEEYENILDIKQAITLEEKILNNKSHYAKLVQKHIAEEITEVFDTPIENFIDYIKLNAYMLNGDVTSKRLYNVYLKFCSDFYIVKPWGQTHFTRWAKANLNYEEINFYKTIDEGLNVKNKGCKFKLKKLLSGPIKLKIPQDQLYGKNQN
jgi:hypothetical protein